MIKASIIVDNDYSKNRIFDDYLNKNIFDGRSFKYIALKLKVKIVEGEEISNTFIA